MLKKRIIDVAIDEINAKTDLQVGYDLQNEGRRITAILFRVGGIPKHQSEQNINAEILNKLHAMGIREKTAREILEKHDEDYILANIRIVEEDLSNGKDIRNIPAYLMKAFEVDFRPLETEFDRLQKEKKVSKSLEYQQAEEAQQKRLDQQKDFEIQKAEAIEAVLKSLKSEDALALKEEFLIEIQNSLLFKKVLGSK